MWRARTISLLVQRQIVKDRYMIQLEGVAPVQTRTVRIQEDEMELNWMDATHWRLTIPDMKKGDVTLEFLDYDGNLIGKDSIQIQ